MTERKPWVNWVEYCIPEECTYLIQELIDHGFRENKDEGCFYIEEAREAGFLALAPLKPLEMQAQRFIYNEEDEMRFLFRGCSERRRSMADLFELWDIQADIRRSWWEEVAENG